MTSDTANPDVTTKARQAAAEVKGLASEIEAEYANGDDRPLGGYLKTMGLYGAAVGALAVAARLTGRRLPDRISAGDFALLSVGTHKLTRVIAKDAITSPLRAPFTRYKEPAGAGEVNEEVRSHSELGHSVGELLGCPFCLAVWTSTAFAAGMTFAPRQTRWAATVFSMTAVSDCLQFGYSALKKAE